MTDPRVVHPREPGETRTAYAARLSRLGWPCACGCGQPLVFDRSDVNTRGLFRRGHAPMPPEAIRRRVTARLTRRAYSRQGTGCRAWWTPARRAARAAHTRALWRAGVWFGKHWRGGIRAELLRTHPAHAEWIRSLSEDDLAGLQSVREVAADDGLCLAPGHSLRKLMFGEADSAEGYAA